MRRGLVLTGAWMLATSAAVAMSWFGVHTVLAGTAYDPPRALPVSGGEPTRADAPMSPESSSTRRPRPSVDPPTPSPTPPGTPNRPSPGGGSPSATAPAGTATGNVHSYTADGGRVALDLGASSATLVSATPDPGWSMQVWKQPAWIRVDFTSGNHTTSVFCTWNGHPPWVQTYAS